MAFSHHISPPKPFIFLVSHYVPHTPPISFILIPSPESCAVSCTSHKTPIFCGQSLPLFKAIFVTAESDRTVMAAVLKMRIWIEAEEPVCCWYHFNCVKRLGSREWEFGSFRATVPMLFRWQVYWWDMKISKSVKYLQIFKSCSSRIKGKKIILKSIYWFWCFFQFVFIFILLFTN